MRAFLIAAICTFMTAPQGVFASSACASTVITTAAAVSVTDGTKFRVDTYFRSPDESAVSFFGPNASDIVSEGPYAWFRQGENSELASDKEKRFAMGHQYHAMLNQFDTFMTDIQTEQVYFQGESRNALTGRFPYGGKVSLVRGLSPGRPAGLLMLLPEETPIEVTLEDWREYGGHSLPFALQIYHGERVFRYEFESVEFTRGGVADFHARMPTPAIEEIRNYRDRRRSSALQCDDDR